MHYVVFDVETTGLKAWRGDRIIEIGALSVRNGVIFQEFQSLIDIGKRIPKKAQKVHGITKEMLFGQPKAGDVLKAFREFAGSSVLVAHNADFDMSFLRFECSRLGLSLNNRCLCTLKMSRRFHSHLSNYRLETVAMHLLGISLARNRHHRALDDARLTAQIWQEMRMEHNR